ncbi:hypothetical protein ALQ04_01953 [Pseudomonas cichorii]|uniref:DUF805 domain-containing protein n=1 Tax=Pseudomonas cichorii TaxID=36746 RepID=A0A3M4M4P5_PSECI|nr:DUF805 domain-containing protein [Pseudomonas cichorii]RMQ48629.1 hypothetical protein ALQ04_01953 [Pseudomonas cichorii]
MADTHFKIMFEGQLRTGVELETAKLNLARLFKSEPPAVERLFNGNPVSLKRGLSHTEAQRYIQALNDAGVEAHIEPDPEISLSLDEIDQPRPDRAPVEHAQASSPYAPPKADVTSDLPRYSTLRIFSIQGRIGRLRYLAWSLALIAASLAATSICFAVLSVSLVGGGLLSTIAFAAFVIVSVQIGTQRLHDAGWSGWLLLLNLAPFIGGIFPFLMLLIPGNTGPNKYGAPPPPNSRAVKVLVGLGLVLLALFVTIMLNSGVEVLKRELETTASEYEQSLPYDDDSDSNEAQPAAPTPGKMF